MIVHADLDAFYAAVEQRDDPALRDLPIVVGGPYRRGVVLTCSYEARASGVRSGMAGVVARRLCPKAIFVSPRMSHYAEISRGVHEVFQRYTPVIEPIALDEAFLDVSIRREVLEEEGLTISVGVARNKFLAKLASVESKPDGLLCVASNREREFLDPLPVGRIWGAGQVVQQRLHNLGFKVIGDLRRASLERLQRLFGQVAGLRYYHLRRGQDQRQVGLRSKSSLSHEETFAHDQCDAATSHGVLLHLCESVARRLRRGDKRSGRVRL